MMYRIYAICLVGSLMALEASFGQSFTSGGDSYASPSHRSFPLSAPELRSLCLDNELKEVRLRYEKGVAIAEGRANVAVAKLQASERIAGARFEHAQTRNELRQQRRAVSLARYERQQQAARVEVDLAHRLQWPDALQQDSLKGARDRLEDALGGDRRYVSAGADLDVDEVRRLTKEMFAAIRPLRDQLGDRRLLEAKHYLEGMVRAAEAEAGQDATMDLALR